MSKQSKRRKAIDYKKYTVWLVGIVLVFMIGVNLASQLKPTTPSTTYTEFLKHLNNDEVEKVNIYNNSDYFTALLKDGTKIDVPNPRHDEFRKEVYERGVEVSIQKASFTDALSSVMVGLPMLIFAGCFMMYVIHTLGSATKNYFNAVDQEDGKKFDEVAGLGQLKDELRFVVDFLSDVDKYKASGAKPPKGILLQGPPGTGKTLIAKAIAGEANVPFISCCGTDFVEMYIGLGARRIRELFEYAQANKPCVVFIDEIDALCRNRNDVNSHTESKNTLNQLLKSMDGVEDLSGVMFIGATNLASELDPAILRPGRFDRIVQVDIPTLMKDREEIVKVHTKGKKLDEGVDTEYIASMTKGLSGAEIEGVINSAVLISLMDGKEGVIGFKELDKALTQRLTKGNLGEVKGDVESDITAVHEAGHALVSLKCGKTVRKVTIVPTTSGYGGFTLDEFDGEDVKMYLNKEEVINEIKILYGGLVAERMLFGSNGTGVSNDLDRATKLITKLVTEFAMGDDLVNMIDLDRKYVANEVRALSKQFYKETMEMLDKEEIRQLADRLLEEHSLYNLKGESWKREV